jgi:hypothetical protein
LLIYTLFYKFAEIFPPHGFYCRGVREDGCGTQKKGECPAAKKKKKKQTKQIK